MQKVQKYEEHLMQAIGFDEGDLEANRAGELSDRQRLALVQAAAGFGVGVAGSIFFGWLILTNHADGLIIFAVIGGVWFATHLSALLLDLFAPKPAIVEGYLAQEIKKQRYFLKVDRQSFSVRDSIFLTFKNGDPYRIYYAPHSKRILSVEWLRYDENLI